MEAQWLITSSLGFIIVPLVFISTDAPAYIWMCSEIDGGQRVDFNPAIDQNPGMSFTILVPLRFVGLTSDYPEPITTHLVVLMITNVDFHCQIVWVLSK